MENMLRACVLDFKGSWDQYLALVEFAYNNSYQATVGMALYEALYGWKCQTPLYWNEVGERKIVAVENVPWIEDAHEKVSWFVKEYKLHKVVRKATPIITDRTWSLR